MTTDTRAANNHATLYRMVMPGYTCPFGLKALHLLKSKGFEVEDHLLRTRAETDAFKADLDVRTTPQVFIGGERIGGYDALRKRLGLHAVDPDATTYRPVVTVFVVAALLAVAASWTISGGFQPLQSLQWFATFSMAILALLKLQDVEKFSTMFLNYDVLARAWVPYAYAYPFLELLAAVLMTAGVLTWLSAPIALAIGSIGAFSVAKAVYWDKRTLKCACVGGSTSVPLGFVSLTENVIMIAMAIWMIAKVHWA